MAFDGYLRLNTVEIANAARTARYLENLLPTFGLVCPPCEGLEAALDETYSTPLTDNAPWYDPSMPSSGSFYGFYPLSIEGIDDSTRTAVTTELVGDGSITNRPRFAGRDIRVNGVLIGATEQAVDTGMAWLNRALSGPCDGTDDCLGGDLNFYSTCPPVQDWSGVQIYPIDSDRDGLPAEAELWDPSGAGFVNAPGTTIVFAPAAAGEFFTRQVSGLIPGETYRFSLFGIDSAGGVKVEIVEGAEFTFDFHHAFVAGPPVDPTLAPLDFIAPSDTVTIYLTPWDYETNLPSATSFQVSRIVLQRTQVKATVLQTEYNQFGTPSGGWVAEVPAGTTASLWVRDVTESTVAVSVGATSGTVSYPAGSGVTREIQYTGQRSRVTVVGQFEEDTYAGSVSVTMSGASNVTTVYSAIDTSLVTSVQFMVTLEFDFATVGSPATLAVETTAGTTIGVSGANTAQWDIHYLLVETVDEPLLIDDPNPGLGLERVLRQVVATSGPVTAERLAPPCGAMRRVTFSLRAGVPFHYGTPAEVGNVFGSEAAAMPEITCLGGTAITLNYVTNPRFVTAAGVSVGGGFTTISTYADQPTAPSGRRASVGGGTTAGVVTFTYTIPGSRPLTEDAPYTFGIFVMSAAGVTINTMTLTTTGATVTTNFVDEPVVVPASAGLTQWYPVQVTVPAGDTVTTVSFALNITRVGSGSEVYFSAPMLTFGTSIEGYDSTWSATDPHDLGYFDGSMSTAAWLNPLSPDASASIAVGLLGGAPTVYDPACPPLPDPPAPPTIDDDCLVLPDSWLRYALDVPARFIPVTSSASPIVTVVTTAALNNVRIRFYPADLGQFATCGFVAEMLLSYIPAGATVVLDATQRTAILTGGGFVEQSVTHLLYGPNGGPIEWPDLTCGQEYIFTVDVEPTGDISGSQVLLDMAVRY
jgi:hypothetical protein